MLSLQGCRWYIVRITQCFVVYTCLRVWTYWYWVVLYVWSCCVVLVHWFWVRCCLFHHVQCCWFEFAQHWSIFISRSAECRCTGSESMPTCRHDVSLERFMFALNLWVMTSVMYDCLQIVFLHRMFTQCSHARCFAWVCLTPSVAGLNLFWYWCLPISPVPKLKMWKGQQLFYDRLLNFHMWSFM